VLVYRRVEIVGILELFEIWMRKLSPSGELPNYPKPKWLGSSDQVGRDGDFFFKDIDHVIELIIMRIESAIEYDLKLIDSQQKVIWDFDWLKLLDTMSMYLIGLIDLLRFFQYGCDLIYPNHGAYTDDRVTQFVLYLGSFDCSNQEGVFPGMN